MKDIKSPERNTFDQILPIIILTALSLLTYADTVHVPFIFDDLPNITENPLIRMTEITPDALARVLKSRATNRPLANLSYALNYFFHGYDVRGYHLVNLVIHVITVFLIFLVARQTLGFCGTENRWAPLLAAGLWLVNPLHTQSVTYVVQRMNSMAAMFFMLALYLYIRARITIRSGRRPSSGVLLLFLCLMAAVAGLAAKEIVATLSVVIFLYEWFFFQNLDRAWIKKQLPWIGLIVLTFSILALLYMNGTPLEEFHNMYEEQDFTPAQRLLTEANVVIYYISLLVFPHPGRLVLDYDFPLSQSPADPFCTSLAMAALLMLFAWAVYAARKHRLFSFAVFWFLITLAIESSFVGLALIFEHRTYLPSIFPVIALTALLLRTIRPGILAGTILCLAIVVCGFWTYQRNTLWQNPMALWTDNIAKTPQLANPYISLGYAYSVRHEINKAINCYKRMSKISKLDKNAYVISLSNIGALLLLQNRPQEAIDYLQKVIKAAPDYEVAYVNLGIAFMNLGQTDEAITFFKRALEINPYLEEAYYSLGKARFLTGDVNSAITAFEQALAINPNSYEISKNYKKVKQSINDYGSLIDRWKHAVLRQPEDPESAFQLGRVSQLAGMTDQAIFWYEKAIQLQPDNYRYMNILSTVFLNAGRLTDGLRLLEQLASLTPGDPTVFYNLARVYARKDEKEKSAEMLRKAIDNGYNNWPQLFNDTDLKNISNTVFYKYLEWTSHLAESPSCTGKLKPDTKR